GDAGAHGRLALLSLASVLRLQARTQGDAGSQGAGPRKDARRAPSGVIAQALGVGHPPRRHSAAAAGSLPGRVRVPVQSAHVRLAWHAVLQAATAGGGYRPSDIRAGGLGRSQPQEEKGLTGEVRPFFVESTAFAWRPTIAVCVQAPVENSGPSPKQDRG